MLVGYANAGRDSQPLHAQLWTLSEAGCAKVFAEEQRWMSKSGRDALEGALDFVTDGDTLVITECHCLCQSSSDLDAITSRLVRKGASLLCLCERDSGGCQRSADGDVYHNEESDRTCSISASACGSANFTGACQLCQVHAGSRRDWRL